VLAALAALKEHNASVLLVAKRDRLARDVLVAAMVERLAERTGARVVAADGTAEGDGPEAVLMRRIVDALVHVDTIVATYCCLLLIRSGRISVRPEEPPSSGGVSKGVRPLDQRAGNG